MHICSVLDCDEPKKVKGLCEYHYGRKRYKGDTPLHPSKRVKEIKICLIFDCCSEVQAVSLCMKHCRAYHRWRQKSDTSDIKEFIIFEGLRKKRPPIGYTL